MGEASRLMGNSWLVFVASHGPTYARGRAGSNPLFIRTKELHLWPTKQRSQPLAIEAEAKSRRDFNNPRCLTLQHGTTPNRKWDENSGGRRNAIIGRSVGFAHARELSLCPNPPPPLPSFERHNRERPMSRARAPMRKYWKTLQHEV